jgi:kinesin family protein 18/19
MSSTSVSNVLVAVRIRPLNTSEISSGVKSCIQTFDGKVVAIKRNGDAGQYLKSQQTCINEYEYDAVFDEQAPQQVIYEKTAKNYIPKIVDGQNVTVFAYGATGAGKTHTMLGDTRTLATNHNNGGSKIPSLGQAAASSSSASSPHHGGIIPNAVKDLFRLVSAKMASKNQLLHNEQYSIYLSFLEVYNEQVYDLLESSGKILSVQEDQQKGIVIVSGVTEQHVTTYSQVIDFIIQGNKQRKTESTCANALSSRSHAVLQLIVKKSTKLENGKEIITESKLSLIDLAGSERASATNNRGIRLVEGANINKSLLALANCINALSENNSVSSSSSSSSSINKIRNVKFRDSKLTHLLKSSLEGNCHLIMIANINPSDSTYEDSHNTLKYANRAKNIKINPLINSKENKEVNWMEREIQLRNENNQLKSMIIKLQIQLTDLSEFKKYVLTHKSIPGTNGKFCVLLSFLQTVD